MLHCVDNVSEYSAIKFNDAVNKYTYMVLLYLGKCVCVCVGYCVVCFTEKETNARRLYAESKEVGDLWVWLVRSIRTNCADDWRVACD